MDAPIIGITGYAGQPAGNPTFTLSQAYAHAVASAGGAPLILPPHLEQAPLRAVFHGIDGLVLSGGGDIHPAAFGDQDRGLLGRVDRQRDKTELSLARWALTEGLPVLAICRGLQVLNVAAGGTLIHDIPTEVPDALTHSSSADRPTAEIAHTVLVEPNTRLAALLGTDNLGTNSAHHQAAKAIGDDLVVTARASDGVIEAMEAPDHPFYIGVQWHPEVMVEQAAPMLQLFQGLIKAAHS